MAVFVTHTQTLNSSHFVCYQSVSGRLYFFHSECVIFVHV